MNQYEELVVIAMEECAEVQHALSKCIRFQNNYSYSSNWKATEKEIGDLVCLITLMIDKGYISEERITEYAEQKKVKLRHYSSLLEEQKDGKN